jgi:dTDP-glucose 4,6-dehydratase
MGSHFVRHLLNENLAEKVAVFDNLSYSSDRHRLQGYESRFIFIEGDLRESAKLNSATDGFDIVFNFAAETHNDNSLERPLDFIQTNIVGTSNLLEAARLNGFHLHQVSTDEVYGDLPLGSPDRFTETSSFNPSSPYSASKAASDHLVKAWARSFGVRATITNSANNFGSGQHPEKLIPRTISLIRSGRPPELYGKGKNVRDWIHVDDHSRAVWLVATQGTAGESYLVSANQLISNLELVQMINGAFGKPRDLFEFISDRPGHDLQYSSDSAKLRDELSWSPNAPSLEEWLNGAL